MAAAFFLEYMAALSLGSIFSGTLFGMCRRQIFRLDEAAELTFTYQGLPYLFGMR